ncbi:MAG: AmmeMemoRadiSam system protein A [Clostridia bacterium]|nr:AmmeMemoRadiSam system protein A [Clostridia bacterium]
MPEVGRGGEEAIRNTQNAYRAAMRRAAELQPETVVLISPHLVMYSDYFHISPGTAASGDFSQFHAPGVRVEAVYDEDFAAVLSERSAQSGIPAGMKGERTRELDHGTMIPLRFLQEFGAGFRLVRIGVSGLSPLMHYRLGQIIARTAEEMERRVVVIASGDLSHKLRPDGPYGFTPEGPKFDREITEMMAAGDFLGMLQMDPESAEAAAECGLRAFWVMAGALDRKAVKSRLLSYEGPFGVGYGVASFEVEGDDDERDFGRQYGAEARAQMEAKKASENPYVRLARLSLETYVKTGLFADLPCWLPEEMTGKAAGAFVSLKKDGHLRGCIGTISPTQPSLAKEILTNAVSAGLRDPRFAPVTEEELSELVYSVDVLGEPEPIESKWQLDVKRYGVIVEKGHRRGLLLPDLTGVETPEKQIEIARQKASIAPDEPIKLWRFEVVRHK